MIKYLLRCSFFVFIIMFFTTCTFPDEYLLITIINKTSEKIDIDSGFIFQYKINAKSEENISVGKGYVVSAKGEDTKSDYGSMIFNKNGERWVIE